MPTDSKNLPSAIVCLEDDFLLSAEVCIRLTPQTFVIGVVSIIERNDRLNESKTGKLCSWSVYFMIIVA